MKRLIPILLASFCLAACHKGTTNGSSLSKESLSINADTIYEYDLPLLTNIHLVYGNTTLFYDSTTFYETNSAQIIPYNDTIIYFLANEFDPLSMETLHVIRCASKKDISETVIVGQLIKDIDQDGILEIVGKELSEVVYTDSDGTEYVTYNPVIVHKLGVNCLPDKSLTKELTTLKYGCFLGEQYVDTFLLVKTITYKGITIF